MVKNVTKAYLHPIVFAALPPMSKTSSLTDVLKKKNTNILTERYL